MIYIVLVLFPFVAALQRYAVSYGYEGVSKKQAWTSARGVFFIVSLISLVILLTTPAHASPMQAPEVLHILDATLGTEASDEQSPFLTNVREISWFFRNLNGILFLVWVGGFWDATDWFHKHLKQNYFVALIKGIFWPLWIGKKLWFRIARGG